MGTGGFSSISPKSNFSSLSEGRKDPYQSITAFEEFLVVLSLEDDL
jgi:hypothetical protein